MVYKFLITSVSDEQETIPRNVSGPCQAPGPGSLAEPVPATMGFTQSGVLTMHAFALPGLSQKSCENDTSTPRLYYSTQMLARCVSPALGAQCGGVEREVVVVVAVCCLVCSSPSLLLWVATPTAIPPKRLTGGDNPGRALEEGAGVGEELQGSLD